MAAEIVRRSFQIGDRVFEFVNGFGDVRMMLHLAVNILGCGKRDRQRKQTGDSTCKNGECGISVTAQLHPAHRVATGESGCLENLIHRGCAWRSGTRVDDKAPFLK